MLERNVLPNCSLTATDVRNARLVLGPCAACEAGKITEAPAPTSESPPAEAIGDNVHVDLLALEHTSIGGNTVLLITLDEKSNFGHIIAIRRKTTAHCPRLVLQALPA